MALLEKSREEPRLSMEQAVEDAYNLTLKPWHGWISSAAVKVLSLLLLFAIMVLLYKPKTYGSCR